VAVAPVGREGGSASSRFRNIQPLDAASTRVARFLLGQLVFSGYSQMAGVPHVLAPKRSHVMAVAIVRTENPYQEGPDILLERAKELRESSAVGKYRRLREGLLAEDPHARRAAEGDLGSAADRLARALQSSRSELEHARALFVEVAPNALGGAAGALIGTLVGGPPGTVAGGVLGALGPEAVRAVNERLWGWVVDRLPFRSATKLLTRAVRAERDVRSELLPRLRTIWETPRRSS
jgi:hypothetical protein